MHDFTPARKQMQWCHSRDSGGIAARYRHETITQWSMNRLCERIDKNADGLTKSLRSSTMLKRSVALALATVASIGIAASMSTVASAKPSQIQKVQNTPKGFKA